MLTRRLFAAALLSVPAGASLAQGRKDPGSGGMGSGTAPPVSGAGPTQNFNVTGRYSAQGMNADGSQYSGEAQISQNGSRISMTWRVGGDSYSGEGLIEGRVVAVDWGDAMPVVYVVMPDGELHGTWADGTALEKLTPR